ncbi:MAG: acyltransferase family protein [Undibacterium sp.]|nr:acyltransferase family protein [Opitutaceae bacterium]
MSPPATRLPWIDHLRTFVILLVVNMHACVTYSHVGDWYLMSAQEPPPLIKLLFIFWQAHLQSFFMGLMFFLAGYFAQKSFSRRGPRAFFRERLVRLGLPVLFFMMVIHPFIILILNPWHSDLPTLGAFYTRYLSTGRFFRATGPLWFAFALLIFCALLALWRALRPAPPAASATPRVPTAGNLWFVALGLGLATFLMRTVQPIGASVMNFQFCFFPQYIVFFVLGLAASRDRWLLGLAASSIARRAGWLALIGGPVLLAVVLISGGKPTKEVEQLFFGGWNIHAFSIAVWEQFTGVGLSLGLLSFFSRRVNTASAFATWLSDRAFAVYVFHTPVLIALTMFYRPLEPGNALAFISLLTVTGLIASFLVADIARRVPGLRSIL